MIINVRYVLLLAFRGLPLSLKLNLNSKTLSMSYCNSSIFCSAVLQYRACRTCMGGKSDGQFSSTFLSDCQHGFLLSGLFFQMPSLQITNLTHMHTHAWPGSSHRTSHWQHESKNVAVLPKIHSSDFVFFMSVFRPPCRFPREAIWVYMWRRTLKVHIRHIKVPPAGTGQRW